jgi:type IX secretion system PorP/SprF family membrane protein
MKKKIILLASLFFVAYGNIMAQQDKLITHFMYDKMSINPGSTGIEDGICATSLYRNQWDKISGAPNSGILNVEANLTRFFPGGIGISFFHDAIGFNRQNNLLLNYSFPIKIGSAGTLGIGIGAGMVNFGMSPDWVPPTTNADSKLPTEFSATNLDLNFGIYFKGSSDYYVGVSSTHLNESLMTQKVGNIDQKYQMARHYYLMGGKKFRNIWGGDLDAQALVRTDLIKFSSDISVRYIYNDKMYGGLTYRTVDAVGIMLGYIPMKNFTIGYSYDLTTNKLASASRGSHEILLKYCYHLPKPPMSKAIHPRWL